MKNLPPDEFENSYDNFITSVVNKCIEKTDSLFSESLMLQTARHYEFKEDFDQSLRTMIE